MHRTTQSQSRLLSPEAQRAAVWRLAWAGLSPEQIAQRTGLATEQVSRAMHEEMELAQPAWAFRQDRLVPNA